MIVPGAVIASRSGVDVPDVDLSAVRFRPLPQVVLLLLIGPVAAITVGRTVFVHPYHWVDVVAGRRPELTAHELVHVRQWQRDGVIGFLARYLGDYLRLRVLGCGHEGAYRNIGYEWSAYVEAAHIVRRP